MEIRDSIASFLNSGQLSTDSIQIVLGLLLRVLCGLLGVGIGLQMMNSLVQTLGFLSVSGPTAGHIGTGMHARHVGAETIEIHSEIMDSVKGGKTCI